MAENENPNKFQPSRRGPRQHRQPMNPGVRKAVNNFGVRDLRQLLDKKHQEQGDFPTHQKENEARPRGVNPPPDPAYNYLRDSSRDQTKPAYSQVRRNDVRGRQQSGQPDNFRKGKESPGSDPVGVDNDLSGQKKELRFSDPSKPTGRGSFRGGRNTNRRKEEKIENPVNIKVELSCETGQRNCTLDENTKIPDIKHVSDNPRPKSNYRGRGAFRGRRGRSNYSTRQHVGSEQKTHNAEERESTETPPDTSEHSESDKQYHDEHDNEQEESYEHEDDHEDAVDVQDESASHTDNATQNKESANSFDSNLKESITITSSKFQDGETKRDVKVEAVEE